MTTAPERDFDAWLDAFVAGRSTPASRSAAAHLSADLREAARQFHGLAGASPQESGPSFAPTWEDVMNMHAAPAMAGGAGGNRAGGAQAAPPPTYRGSRWHVALNLVLAAFLVATLGIGIWRATDGGAPGGPEPDRPQSAAFAPEIRVFTPEAEATPEDLPLVPTADECTVAPLTVDEVLWYIDDPGEAARTRTMAATPDDAATGVATPTNDEVLATANAFTPGPASPDQLAAMARVQRMWMACVLADSPFQRWAVESPELVKWEASAMFPNFVSEDEARAILEEAERTGVIEPHEDYWTRESSFQMISSTAPPWGAISPVDDPQAIVYPVAVLDTNPLHSWTTDGRRFVVPYIEYLPDGTALSEPGDEIAGMSIAEFAETYTDPLDMCFAFEFTWYPESDWLVVSDMPTCG